MKGAIPKRAVSDCSGSSPYNIHLCHCVTPPPAEDSESIKKAGATTVASALSLNLPKPFFKRFELFSKPFGKTIPELSKVLFNVGNFRPPCFHINLKQRFNVLRVNG